MGNSRRRRPWGRRRNSGQRGEAARGQLKEKRTVGEEEEQRLGVGGGWGGCNAGRTVRSHRSPSVVAKATGTAAVPEAGCHA